MAGILHPPGGIRRDALVVMLVALVGISGCATTGATAPKKNPDPIEGFNRGVYKFNDTLDRYALKPVAKAYRDHVPEARADRRRQLLYEPVVPRHGRQPVPAGQVQGRRPGRAAAGDQHDAGLGRHFRRCVGRSPAHSRRRLWSDPWTLGSSPRPVPGVAVPRPGDVARCSGAYRRRFLPALPLV